VAAAAVEVWVLHLASQCRAAQHLTAAAAAAAAAAAGVCQALAKGPQVAACPHPQQGCYGASGLPAEVLLLLLLLRRRNHLLAWGKRGGHPHQLHQTPGAAALAPAAAGDRVDPGLGAAAAAHHHFHLLLLLLLQGR
jgi:hypothetical protein